MVVKDSSTNPILKTVGPKKIGSLRKLDPKSGEIKTVGLEKKGNLRNKRNDNTDSNSMHVSKIPALHHINIYIN